MKKKLISAISLLLLLLLLSACAMLLPSDGLPERGDPANMPVNSVSFGIYGGNPISWYVLDNSDGKLLLISRYILNQSVYDATDGTAWADSDMRTWLNGEFYNDAFSDLEKSVLVGDDKVTLLTQAQAANSAYFGNDSVRTASLAGSGSASPYWITGDDSKAGFISGPGAIVTPANATLTLGIRPVITVDASAIAMSVNSTIGSGDGVLNEIDSPVMFAEYNLALWDDTLPTLSVSDYGIDETDVLWIDCTVSTALSADEKVFAYLANQSGGYNYIGWSSIADGQLSYSLNMITSDAFDVRLVVVKTIAGRPTYAVGSATALSAPVQMLSIDGIAEGGSYVTGQTLSFTAIGVGMGQASPYNGDERWVPVNWSAGAQSGSWSGTPYTGSLVFDTPGEYTLSVLFQDQHYDESTSSWIDYEDSTETRTVTFTVAQELTLAASPADGAIYTGGRITITPNLSGGTWDFDSAFLSQDGNSFTGLKAGTTTVTYTAGAQSKNVTVTIRQSDIPNTGQNMTGIGALLGAAVIALAAGVLMRRRISARQR